MRAKKILLGMCACLAAVGLIGANQESANSPASTPEQKRQIAVSVMRIINTAEVTHRYKAGRYAALEEFAPAELDTSRARSRNPAIPTIDPRAGKDAVAGFELRITVALDGNSYAVALKDKDHTSCGTDSFTDDVGVIYLAGPIDCNFAPLTGRAVSH